ncbi:TetR/AcrR family transcriptional regulator [Staphylococcus simiae]|uniref:HTH tetR-type domain-containing protein n=1 Tax=Staphylococcus simiae CCM 7213 = CCUG 51256 TaxID=911238 RepID=G5JHL0_9STAP|nr:TetR/AcrR family transcriptional regulator [Staphylococcus simiae]EHJ08316.1 hypothetical protein SS7213T_04711 [Staphylococcus simiae CCM 7213 = CCUG 51256]PNZ09439.1 TetR/AcrR family transcriptional regulator [Staphylococcus simiae]
MDEQQFTDTRIVKTKHKIRQGLLELLLDKSFDDIAIKDICQQSGVSRATFYLHYKDKNDLIIKLQHEVMAKGKRVILNQLNSSRKAFFMTLLNFWQQEGEIILLLISDRGSELIRQQVKKTLQANIEVSIIPIVRTQHLSTKEKYFLVIFLSNAIFGVLQDWVNRGRPETVEEVAGIMDKIYTSVFK